MVPFVVVPVLVSEIPQLPELAHSPWELATWVIIGIVAIIAFWIWTEHRSTRSQIKDVSDMLCDVKGSTDIARTELRNDRPPEQNLRNQIDHLQRQNEILTELVKGQNTVLDEIRSRQNGHGRDIRGIRADVGQLRGEDRVIKDEHDDLVRRLNGFIRREHPGADPL